MVRKDLRVCQESSAVSSGMDQPWNLLLICIICTYALRNVCCRLKFKDISQNILAQTALKFHISSVSHFAKIWGIFQDGNYR